MITKLKYGFECQKKHARVQLLKILSQGVKGACKLFNLQNTFIGVWPIARFPCACKCVKSCLASTILLSPHQTRELIHLFLPVTLHFLQRQIQGGA